MLPLSPFVIQYLVDLPMFTIVDIANVIVNVENVLDLHWSPSNLHIHPLHSVFALHLLKTLCHVFPVVMSFVVSPTSIPLAVFIVKMSYVVLLQAV